MKQMALTKQIINDKLNGLTDQEIGSKHGVNLRFIERAITKETGVNVSIPHKKITSNKLEPKDFKLEQNTVWSFKSRGTWATHNGNYRGNWSPYIPRNVILRYSDENDVVLDYFCGGGTTAIEAKLLNRKFIGIDINPHAVELAKENLNFNYSSPSKITLKVGDARNLDFIDDSSIDLICAHPPYANIVNYTHDNLNDLSSYEVESFLMEMKKVAKESYRVLKDNKYCAILIGDMRKNKNVIPLGFKTISVFLNEGFKLKELVIKRQHNCKTTGFWYNNSIKFNFLLLAHEYLAIFEKSDKQVNSNIENFIIKPLSFKIDKDIYLEAATAWIFKEKDYINKTISNLIKRYATDYCLYNKEFKKSKLTIYFYDSNFNKFLTDVNSLDEDDLIAIICEDKCLNNDFILSEPIKIENEISKNDKFKIKEIIILSNEELKKQSYKSNLSVSHKYILIFRKVK